jgi:ATP-dependent exoDNAse (exonuclease V) beta subunit
MNRKKFIHSPLDLGYRDLEANTTVSGRFYTTPSGKAYPSITTVLGIRNKGALQEWRARVGEVEAARVSRHASTRGTALHTAVERYIDNEEHYFAEGEMPHVKDMFNSIKPILDSRIDNVRLQEAPLYSEHLGLAGRVDLIAEFDGRLSIIDFKTSSRVKNEDEIDSYFIQMAAYAIMCEERTDTPVSQGVIVMAVENHAKPLVFVQKRDRWTEELFKTINEYNTKKLFGHA